MLAPALPYAGIPGIAAGAASTETERQDGYRGDQEWPGRPNGRMAEDERADGQRNSRPLGQRPAAAADHAGRAGAQLADRPDPGPPGARRAGRRHRHPGRRHRRAAPGGRAPARPRDRARHLAQHPAARGGRRAAPGRGRVRPARRGRVADRPGPGPGGRAGHRDPAVPGRAGRGAAQPRWPPRRGTWPGWTRSARDGTLTRLVRHGQGQLLAQATAVLERLPAGRRRAGGAAARPGRGGHRRHRRRWTRPRWPGWCCGRWRCARRSRRRPAGRRSARCGRRRAWSPTTWPARCSCSTSGPAGGPLGGWLTEAAEAGEPFRVTLHQLTVMPVMPLAIDLRVCENPAVLRAAAGQLGAGQRAAGLHRGRAVRGLLPPAAVRGGHRNPDPLAQRLRLAGAADHGGGDPAAGRGAVAHGRGRLPRRAGRQLRAAQGPAGGEPLGSAAGRADAAPAAGR